MSILIFHPDHICLVSFSIVFLTLNYDSRHCCIVVTCTVWPRVVFVNVCNRVKESIIDGDIINLFPGTISAMDSFMSSDVSDETMY